MKRDVLLLLTMFLFQVFLIAQAPTLPPSGDNYKSILTQYIGSLVHVTVQYNSPDVTGPDGSDRTGKIWGTPVAHYGMIDQGFGTSKAAPWRAGANECTTIQFSHDVHIEGQPLPAGTYGLFLLLSETGPWTWIFSKNSSGWGSYFYDPGEDVLRVNVMPKDHPHTEWLNYTFSERKSTETTLELQWELKSVPMKITVPDMTDLYIAKLDREFQGVAGFTASNFTAAANYLLEENYNLPKALEWVDRSMEGFFGRTYFTTLSTKAQILLKMNQTEEGVLILEKAMDMPDANVFQVHQLGRSLIALGKTGEALRIFSRNHEKNNGDWPTKVGMVRGLSAAGLYSDALIYAEAALSQAPDQVNKDALRNMITKLKVQKDVN